MSSLPVSEDVCNKISQASLNIYLGRIVKQSYDFLDVGLADDAIDDFRKIFKQNCLSLSEEKIDNVIVRPDAKTQMENDVIEIKKQLKTFLSPIWDSMNVNFYKKGIKEFIKKGKPKFIVLYTFLKNNNEKEVLGYARVLPRYQVAEGRKFFKKLMLDLRNNKTIAALAELEDKLLIDNDFDFFFMGKNGEEKIYIPNDDTKYKNYQNILIIPEEGREIVDRILKNGNMVLLLKELGLDINNIDSNKYNEITKYLASKYGRSLDRRYPDEIYNIKSYDEFRNKVVNEVKDVNNINQNQLHIVIIDGNLRWNGKSNDAEKILDEVFRVILNYGKHYIINVPMRGKLI
ncbi:hypothetical protein [Sulfurisphaera ohwakuensis]|uniref:hypothetical protein n=1 Tax=Sulfurisphaera ohwakuensis TaxID=69656 RepID=UPI0036F37076